MANESWWRTVLRGLIKFVLFVPIFGFLLLTPVMQKFFVFTITKVQWWYEHVTAGYVEALSPTPARRSDTPRNDTALELSVYCTPFSPVIAYGGSYQDIYRGYLPFEEWRRVNRRGRFFRTSRLDLDSVRGTLFDSLDCGSGESSESGTSSVRSDVLHVPPDDWSKYLVCNIIGDDTSDDDEDLLSGGIPSGFLLSVEVREHVSPSSAQADVPLLHTNENVTSRHEVRSRESPTVEVPSPEVLEFEDRFCGKLDESEALFGIPEPGDNFWPSEIEPYYMTLLSPEPKRRRR